MEISNSELPLKLQNYPAIGILPDFEEVESLQVKGCNPPPLSEPLLEVSQIISTSCQWSETSHLITSVHPWEKWDCMSLFWAVSSCPENIQEVLLQKKGNSEPTIFNIFCKMVQHCCSIRHVPIVIISKYKKIRKLKFLPCKSGLRQNLIWKDMILFCLLHLRWSHKYYGRNIRLNGQLCNI